MYELLLNTDLIVLNPRGLLKELIQRVYENRKFIVTQLSLPEHTLDLGNDPYSGAQGDSDDDPITCEICQGPPAADDIILKCDGEHDVETGYHQRCLPLVLSETGESVMPPVPEEELLCPKCTANGVMLIIDITNKRSRPHTQY